jgi:RND family efflux transporter MFP subunit
MVEENGVNHSSPAAPPTRSATRSWLGKFSWPVLLLLAFGAGWAVTGKGAGHEKESLPPEPAADGRDPSAVVVAVEPVSRRSVQRTIEAVGTLHGFEEVSISAKVEGRVRKLHRDVADSVKPGDLLLEIDPTDYDLSVEQADRSLQVELAKLGLEEPPQRNVDLGQVPSVMQARTRLENTRSRYERVRRVAAARATSMDELDNAASDSKAAQAEHANQLLMARATLATIRMKQTALAISRQQLADTRVSTPTPTLSVPGATPVAYVVTQRAVAEGTFVKPGNELFKLVINRTLKLRVSVPERYSNEVRQGQKAEVMTAAFSRPFAGTVTRINPAVETTTRTFEVEIQVPNPNGELKPGGFAKASILTRLDSEAVTVPLAALVNFAGITKVFLAEKGRAREVQVALGVQTTEWVEITRPALPRSALVITSGQTVLASDTAVIVRAAPAKGPAGSVASRDRP